MPYDEQFLLLYARSLTLTAPIRLQLSRRKGFDLQALSRAFNGLDAVNCARPSKWGNPFLVHPNQKPDNSLHGGQYRSVPTVEDAIECFRLMMTTEPENPPSDSVAFRLRADIGELRGKNLACWCKPGPCHCDVLLIVANAGEVDGR